jgi:hypothetical protein
MRKKKEMPSWLKIETFIIAFFILALTLNYFRVSSGGVAGGGDKTLIEYSVLSGSLILTWVASWLIYLKRGR